MSEAPSSKQALPLDTGKPSGVGLVSGQAPGQPDGLRQHDVSRQHETLDQTAVPRQHQASVSQEEPSQHQVPRHSKRQSSWIRRTLADPRAVMGLLAVALVAALAFLGPFAAPHSGTEIVALPYQKPMPEHPLGTDVLGRDVLSILLLGGQGFMIEGFLAAVMGVGIGGFVGIIIGLLSGRLRAALLFSNDTVMVVPQILIVLIVIAAFSANAITLTAAVAVAQVPYAARVVQAATQKVVHEDYYLAGQMAGQSRLSLMFREVLPNIAGPLLVEFGVRLCISFVVLASLSYLGFSAGAGDWGQMIHENKGGIAIQPWAVLSPIACISVFLIGMNLLRDRVSNALSGW
ncbi:MAG: ABC transporter permease [Coriobacteriaceae bacterium]|jgi:peptide/nickel transport system permease protein|nr:ABC transporter permease [Coriobacteriaceae bacterium]